MSAWIGVDLDGTLANYEPMNGSWPNENGIGEPIGPMQARVLRWLAEGLTVKILTARVSYSGSDLGGEAAEWRDAFVQEQKALIKAWCKKHLGQELDVVCCKDYDMVELWDDRAVAVERNTGRFMGGCNAAEKLLPKRGKG